MEITNIGVGFVNTGAIIIALLLFFVGEIKGQCPHFLSGSKLGVVQNRLLDEISGIAASRKNTDVLWAHNDSGSKAQVWAFNIQGTHLGTYTLTDADNNDWEDMAIGPGPSSKTDYLYIGDLGNNDGLTERTYNIYRVAEPKVNASQQALNININDIDILPVKYPHQFRHDCETLLVDPLNSDIYLCTRDRWNDDRGMMKVYRYPASQQTPGVVFTLQHVKDVQLTTLAENKRFNWEMASGGDISSDGSFVIIRTRPKRKGMPQGILVWQHRTGTDFWDSFGHPPCVAPSLWEPQGEAICFDANGSGYYTVSEGCCQPIYYFAGNGHGSALQDDLEINCNAAFAGWQQQQHYCSEHGVHSAGITGAGSNWIINLNDLGLLADNWFWAKYNRDDS